jgi:hypothetical protein
VRTTLCSSVYTNEASLATFFDAAGVKSSGSDKSGKIDAAVRRGDHVCFDLIAICIHYV